MRESSMYWRYAEPHWSQCCTFCLSLCQPASFRSRDGVKVWFTAGLGVSEIIVIISVSSLVSKQYFMILWKCFSCCLISYMQPRDKGDREQPEQGDASKVPPLCLQQGWAMPTDTSVQSTSAMDFLPLSQSFLTYISEIPKFCLGLPLEGTHWLVSSGSHFLQVTRQSPNSYVVIMNGSCVEVDVHRLSDGGLLLSYDGSSYTTYMKEEVDRWVAV